MIGHVACTEAMRNIYRMLVRKAEGKRDNFQDLDIDGKIILQQGENVNWIHLAKDQVKWQALVNMVMKFWV
jgi:hypothetical protein